MPKLSKALNLPKIKNRQVRPTAIRLLKRASFEDREIISVSGHKTISTLSHYDPAPSTSKQIEMARAIANGGTNNGLEETVTLSKQVVSELPMLQTSSNASNSKEIIIAVQREQELAAQRNSLLLKLSK